MIVNPEPHALPGHTFELEIAATAEAIWDALTNQVHTPRSYYGWRLELPSQIGAPYVYRSDNGRAQIEGEVLVCEPPRRLAMTARYLFDAHARHDPPHRVTWDIEPLDTAPPRCRVRVAADGFAAETTAYKLAVNDLTAVLRAVRNLLDPDALPSRRERISPPVICPLTPERAADFLNYFDHDAFADNPYWAHCYCTHFHDTPAPVGAGVHTAAENRARAADLVACGQMQGYLAYVDGHPAGWCNAAPRTAIPRLRQMPRFEVPDAEQVGSIVCLLVARPCRRHGIARLLLDATADGFRQQGLAYAEAYPVKALSRASEASTPLPVYLSAGFQLYRDLGHGTIVRRSLRA